MEPIEALIRAKGVKVVDRVSLRDFAIVDNFIDNMIPAYEEKDNPDIARIRRAWGRILRTYG